MFRRLKFASVMIVGATLSCGAIAQGIDSGRVLYEPPQDAAVRADFERDMHRLTAVQESSRLPELKQAAAEIEAAWRDRDATSYATLLSVAADSIGSFDSSPQGAALANGYAMAALDRADGALSLEMEIHLILRLLVGDAAPGSMLADPDATRRARVRLFLRALQRVDSHINTAFNFADLPSLNVSVPGVMIAGGDPEAVRDPEVRAAYKAAIEANRKKAMAIGEQRTLRQLKERLLRLGEPILIRRYSGRPDRAAEFRCLLLDLLGNAALREHLRAAVAAGPVPPSLTSTSRQENAPPDHPAILINLPGMALHYPDNSLFSPLPSSP